MSFQITCPNCGLRDSGEFRFGGEVKKRPDPNTATAREWAHYVYARKNESGDHREWWFHRMGCRRWFQAIRNTKSNIVAKTFWPEDASEHVAAEEAAADAET